MKSVKKWFKNFNLVKLKPSNLKNAIPKLTVDRVLQIAQYCTYAFIVVRVLIFGVQKVVAFKIKLKK